MKPILQQVLFSSALLKQFPTMFVCTIFPHKHCHISCWWAFPFALSRFIGLVSMHNGILRSPTDEGDTGRGRQRAKRSEERRSSAYLEVEVEQDASGSGLSWTKSHWKCSVVGAKRSAGEGASDECSRLRVGRGGRRAEVPWEKLKKKKWQQRRPSQSSAGVTVELEISWNAVLWIVSFGSKKYVVNSISLHYLAYLIHSDT